MAQPPSSRSTARLSRPHTASSSSSLTSARLTGPQHFRYHSKDERHHWSINVAESKSFLPSPPFELSVAYPSAAALDLSQRSPVASRAPRLSSRPASHLSQRSSCSSPPPTSLPARQHASYISHLQRHRHLHSDVLRSSCGLRTAVLPFMQQRTDQQNDKERVQRRRRRAAESGGAEPTLLSRSTSSVERVYTAMSASQQRAERVVREKTEAERKRREEDEEQRRRSSDAIAGEQEQDAVSDHHSIPAGFYYAKQFDFFSTVRQKSDEQRKERVRQDREAAVRDTPTGDAAAAAAIRTEEEQKQQTVRRHAAAPLIAQGRKSDWLVDGWWEAKKHFQTLRHAQDAGGNAQLQIPHTAPVVPPELLVPLPASVSASSSSVASLFSAAERPPLTYEPVTPLWLSSRSDYTRLQPEMLSTLALNALHKQPQSRSTLEQRMLSLWTQRLPLFDRGEAAGGAELLAVSVLLKKQAGDVLYTEGEIGTAMFVLLEGNVTLHSAAAAAASPTSPAATRKRQEAAAAGRLTRANTIATGRETQKEAHTAAHPVLRPATAGPAFASHVPHQRPQHAHSTSALASVASVSAPSRALHPFALLGARRSDLTAEPVSVSAPAGRGWSLLRQLLSLSHKFQFSNIGRLADNRQRLDTATCSSANVSLLCLTYSDYDRIVRQWAERQSRQTLSLFRGVDLFSRLKIRALHRLGKAITIHQYAARDWFTSSSAESSADFCFFLCNGTVKLYKAVHVISYHRELGHWQREKLHKRLGVDYCSGPAMLGAEALLGVQHYDTHFRAVSECQVFVLRRRDFHLLMHPQTLAAVEKRVIAQRANIPIQALKAVEAEERAKAEVARKSPRPIQFRVEMTANDGDLTVGRSVWSAANSEDENHGTAVAGKLSRAEVESVQVVMNFSEFLSLC